MNHHWKSNWTLAISFTMTLIFAASKLSAQESRTRDIDSRIESAPWAKIEPHKTKVPSRSSATSPATPKATPKKTETRRVAPPAKPVVASRPPSRTESARESASRKEQEALIRNLDQLGGDLRKLQREIAAWEHANLTLDPSLRTLAHERQGRELSRRLDEIINRNTRLGEDYVRIFGVTSIILAPIEDTSIPLILVPVEYE